MDFNCHHISRSFSHIEHTPNGDMYLYICHDCQCSFLSTQVPKREDYNDADLYPEEDYDY